MTRPVDFSNNQNAHLISMDIPIISENFQRNVRYMKLAVAGVAGVAFTALCYIFIRPHLMSYNGHIADIQNAMKCMNEPQNSLMSGCKNNVYCMQSDSGAKKFQPFYPPTACVNDRVHVLFDGCKWSMENDVAKYLNSTSYAKQLFDKFYFETVVQFAP